MDYKVYLQDGTEHTYSEEDLGKFIKEGTWPGYSPEQNPVINVQTNDGLISVPFTKQNVIEAVQNNFNLEDSGTATNRAWDEKVNEGSSIVNTARTFAEGLEESAFFGVSPISGAINLLTGNEYGQQEREARERVNPTSAFLGEAAGFALPGGAALKGTALGSKALGQVLAKGTLAGWSEKGVQAAGGLAKTALGGLGARTAARAAEGSLLSLTNDLGAKYIEDKELGAEEIAGNAAWSAIIGGGVEGALGSLGLLGKKASDKIVDIKNNTLDKAADLVVTVNPSLTKDKVKKVWDDREIVKDIRNEPEIIDGFGIGLAKQESKASKEYSEITRDFNKNLYQKVSGELSSGNVDIAVAEGIAAFQKVFQDTTGTGLFAGEGIFKVLREKSKESFDDLYEYLAKLSDKRIEKTKISRPTGKFKGDIEAAKADSLAEILKQTKEIITGKGVKESAEEIQKGFFERAVRLRSNLIKDYEDMISKGIQGQLGSPVVLVKSAINTLDNYLGNTSAFGKAGQWVLEAKGPLSGYLTDLAQNTAVPNIWVQTGRAGKGKIGKLLAADEKKIVSMLRDAERFPETLTRLNSRLTLRDSVINAMESFANKVDDSAMLSRVNAYKAAREEFKQGLDKAMKEITRISDGKKVLSKESLGILRQMGPFSVGWAMTGSPVGGMLATMGVGIAEDPMIIQQFLDLRHKLANTSAGNFVKKATGLVDHLVSGAVSTAKGASSTAKMLSANYPSFRDYDDKHENIRQLTPESIKQYIDEHMGEVLSVDPQLRSALESKLIEMMRNIQKDLPQIKQQLMGKPLPSNKLKNRNINDKIAIASDVSKIVDIIQSGRVNKEVMDFFANNYPKHYQALVRQITDRMHEVKNTVANRRVVSLILGTPVTLSQENIQHLQKTYGQKGTPNQARPVARVSERAMEKDRQAHMTDTSRLSYGIKN